jgi:hypothetical protein
MNYEYVGYRSLDGEFLDKSIVDKIISDVDKKDSDSIVVARVLFHNNKSYFKYDKVKNEYLISKEEIDKYEKA